MSATPERVRNAALLGLTVLTVGTASYLGARRTSAAPELTTEPLAIQIPKFAETEEQKLLVQIVGEVKKPGIYEFTEPIRVREALKKAGGATSNADLSKLNLVEKIKDGMRIDVKRKSAAKKPPTTPSSKNRAPSARKKPLPGKLPKWTPTVVFEQDQSELRNLRVDPTTASIEQLMKLPGATIEIAKNIVRTRQSTHGFRNLEELDQVPGIGPATLQRWKPYLVFD